MSTPTRNNHQKGVPKPPPAASQEGVRPGGASVEDRADGDRQMLERCLAGDGRAWESIYRRFHPCLRQAVELLLGSDAGDVHVVEEIAARVWYALLRDERRLLEAYDPGRDSGLEAFLTGLARIEVMRYTRAERRRMLHEFSRGRRRLQEQPVSDCELAAMMDEFVATLTARQKQQLEGLLAAPAEDGNGKGLDHLSSCAVRQRRRRLSLKLREFLKDL